MTALYIMTSGNTYQHIPGTITILRQNRSHIIYKKRLHAE